MKSVRVIALVALAFLAVTATWGAVLLIGNPSGSPMEIPVSVLQYSPFHSFLIPGILLLLSSGVLGTVVFFIVLYRRSGFGCWTALQGCVLFGWITIEVIMLRTLVWLHYVYWGLGLLLIVCGWALHNQAKPASAPKLHAASAPRH
jgi:hypothetical protein